MKPERIDTESGTNHETRTNQKRRPKIENPSLDPLQWKLAPTVEIKSDTPTVEISP